MRLPPRKPDTTSRRENKSLNPGPQKHILSDMRAKYGDDFVDIAAANQEFGKHKLLGLIRAIFSGKFNFPEYGNYLLHPILKGMLGELAGSMSFQKRVYAFGVQIIISNPALAQQQQFPMQELNQLSMFAFDECHAWDIINKGITSLCLYNRIDGLIMAINEINKLVCADGYTKLNRLI